ncbi:class I SAM-dependent methyltransferase [Streptomonospora nanhaiensis]|uniref:Cyclopropane-fatty-acyl-phospholipid synthase n=1 Tax=Streptomonospora nanhaiensis TaxID=1323731 RepID=A0A853BVP3_9ACTN|nr:cyclopropane-fatty-acyl-phospholipid synthase family protein [Streptomonospora nanhaiensis]MBV2363554.1 cyclopropane-fatty-acyl-phospholipid synthase family protein [Streptomonospora nanhaiensis]MBX9390260.1 cyclopropane-fatty-acyl-phospholipid synthase family protein [Streptomonospora nanhaiensis]NYI98567.1 cyclopropane-fatty-acyl-phospholipid synthase [Streptomonospora nanhaiensis]
MRLAEIFERVVGQDAPVHFRAYDGSTAGDPTSDTAVVVRTPVALNYLAQSPGALGLTRAYVSGHIDVEGDMYTALKRMADVTFSEGHRLSPLEMARIARSIGWVKFVNRVPPPPQEVLPTRLFNLGARHAKGRDAEVIHHHYDVSNAFYELVLGPSMTYTCAVFPTADATLEEAQEAKYELVARKLDLREGMRLLDVGCGWGGMVRHAARKGVKALGVTLSKEQAEWASKRIAQEGLSDLAEVRHMDYRDVPDGAYDRISSIGLTEHIGKKNLPAYFASLYAKLKPGGRLLNHCITRPRNDLPPMHRDGVINRYVFPDGELEGPAEIQREMNDAGFEIRHQENLREHYALTLRQWCANLDRNWDAAVREVGQGTARVWRLYMAGCVLGFERNVVQLHQILGVKLDGTDAHMPLRPNFQ